MRDKYYIGRVSKRFRYLDDAEEWVRDLQGRALPVHYSPLWPGLSRVLDEDLATLHNSRLPQAPAAVLEATEAANVSLFRKVLAYPFMALAAAGFCLSVYVHLGSLLGKIVLPESWFTVMQVGVFVAFFPALLLLPKQKIRRRSDVPSTPGFLGSLMIATLAYALANFAIFMVTLARHHNQTTRLMEWRGFSGHWMLFYSWSFAFLYAAAHPARRRHLVG